MRIYRFIPDGKAFAPVGRSWLNGRPPIVNPDGFAVSSLTRLTGRSVDEFWFPESHEGAFAKGPVDTFKSARDEADLPLSDFPSRGLAVPFISEGVVSLLRELGRLPRVLVPVTVDDRRYFAVKTTKTNLCNREDSSWVSLPPPNADVAMFCYRRAFDTSQISGEFFQLGSWCATRDCYITSIFVDEARKRGLTGLDYIELVYDEGGPVIPTYPAPAEKREHIGHYDNDYIRLNAELSRFRFMALSYGSTEDFDYDRALEDLVLQGLVSLRFVQPTYRR